MVASFEAVERAGSTPAEPFAGFVPASAEGPAAEEDGLRHGRETTITPSTMTAATIAKRTGARRFISGKGMSKDNRDFAGME